MKDRDRDRPSKEGKEGKEGKEKGTRDGPVRQKLREMFGMDIRSLAFFRIGMAIATIGDLIERSLDLRAHYSDEGIFPRSILFESYANNYTLFIHAICGHTYFQAFVFLMHGLSALCMLVGWHTRLNTFLCWAFLVSLQSRNPFLNHGGDLYFRLLFLYAIFLPLGGCFSVDSALQATKVKPPPNRSNRVLTGGTVALIAQIVIMYLISTYHKTGEEWTTDYTSTWYALQLDYYRTPLAAILDKFPEFLKFLTWAVLNWEFWGNFCFFMPVFTDYFRLLAVVGYFSMHLGFILCIRLGFFFWVCTVAMFPLVPPLVWDTIMTTKTMRTASQRMNSLRIRYDENSRFSRLLAHIVCTFCMIPTSQLSPIRHETELGLPGKEIVRTDTWLEAETNKTTQNFRAIQALFENSLIYPPTYPLRALFSACARPLRKSLASWTDLAGKQIAQAAHQRHLESYELTPPPKQHRKKPRIRFGDIFILGCALFALSWNASNLGSPIHIPYKHNWIAFVFHIDQFWGMFSPHPPKAHWYYVIQAQGDTGEEFELFRNEGIFKWEGNKPFSFDKPSPFHLSFKNHRWYKFFEMGFNGDHHENIRLNFGRWICREYNSVHSGKERLYTFKVWFMLEWQALYGGRAPPSKQVLWEHVCYLKT